MEEDTKQKKKFQKILHIPITKIRMKNTKYVLNRIEELFERNEEVFKKSEERLTKTEEGFYIIEKKDKQQN